MNNHDKPVTLADWRRLLDRAAHAAELNECLLADARMQGQDRPIILLMVRAYHRSCARRERLRRRYELERRSPVTKCLSEIFGES